MTPTGRAIIQAAVERRVGGPVYLRYAAEVRGDGDLVQEAAGAVAFAAQALGPPTEIYAAAVPGGDDPAGKEPAYVSLAVLHPDGAVSLIGIGHGSRPDAGVALATPPSVLLLGNQGAVERYPGPGAEAGVGAGRTSGEAANAAEGEQLARYAAAIRRSLARGAAEDVEAGRGS